MKLSYNWLQKYFKDPLPTPESIGDGIIFHAFEVETIEKAGDDTLLDIKVLPDRAHDCLSHWGIAKEISVIFGLKISEDILPESKTFKDNLNIQIEDPRCRRYIGRIVTNVKVGPSPKWLADSLVTIGQKSINNIVDATNYVMFDLGNPIHAFDLDKLSKDESGEAIIKVRVGKEGEQLTTLDKKEVKIDESILVIADAKDPLAIAGVKGGTKAEVDNNTKNILIEVANFDPTMVRKTAHKLGIITESAKRFENEINPELASLVMESVTGLILDLAGGQIKNEKDNYQEKFENRKVSFTSSYLNNLLGSQIKNEEIEEILKRYIYKYENINGEYVMEVPFTRLDLDGAHDMAEEIGRIYGYEKISPVLPQNIFNKKDDQVWIETQQSKAILVKNGYKEVMNYTFTNKGDIEVLASASDKNFLRTNLTDGMKKSYELNKLNAPLLGLDEIKIFEIGSVFLKDKEEVRVCYADKKGIKEMKLEEFLKEKNGEFTDFIGNAFPSGNFKPWSIYPFISRDIAVWVPKETDSNELVKIYKEYGGSLLVTEPRLFDQFTKEEKTSYAFRLVFQSYEKTLTDDEINEIMTKITQKISSNNWEVR